MTCDDCGTWVSSTGYLGGGIVCKECARERRKERASTPQGSV